MWEAQYYKHDTPRSLITSGGLGTMGFALPAAIGAKVACPEKDVWVIAGDGGFQMTSAELSTIVQEGLAINIAVINNGFLGMVRQWQEAFYDKNYAASPILSPDFVKLAGAHGIDGAHVSKRADVTPTVTKSRTSGKPFLINFQVEKGTGSLPSMIAPKGLRSTPDGDAAGRQKTLFSKPRRTSYLSICRRRNWAWFLRTKYFIFPCF